jgi:hypothetical protein
MNSRAIVVALVAALLMIQVVRNAVVASVAARSPDQAVRAWANHPDVEVAGAMSAIGRDAREHRTVLDTVFATIARASVQEPLAPEPFLVRGVQAELAGKGATAERAFQAAQWRDPRSLPAAYFLADRYLRAGDVAQGLPQVAALARLAPGGSTTVAPYLAAYARNPGNWSSLRNLFRAHVELAGPTLTGLAADAASAPAVLALADPRQKAADAPWLSPLLNSLTKAGQYGRAQTIWARLSGASAGAYLHDASFSDKRSPPPFNWALTSSAVGLAERQPGGRLHIIFYGQEDGILADQLLLLQPGQYRLSMQLMGDVSRARLLNWSVWCDKVAEPIASVRLDTVATVGWQFRVPSGCPAQWIRLSGAAAELPQQVDATISGLKLEKAGGGA